MSLLGKANDPGLAGSKKPGGLFLWASSSMPSFATPGLSSPGAKPTRGSVVLGSCAIADALIVSVSASADASAATPFPIYSSSGENLPLCDPTHLRCGFPRVSHLLPARWL